MPKQNKTHKGILEHDSTTICVRCVETGAYFLNNYGLHGCHFTFFFIREEGYTFNVNGVSELYFGTVAAVSADNLGQCSIGGFKEGSTAYRGCRQCLVKSNELQIKVYHIPE